MMNRMKEIIKQNGNPVIGSDHYSVMDNYQKMEQFLKSAEQEEKGSVILYEADTDRWNYQKRIIVMMEKK